MKTQTFTTNHEVLDAITQAIEAGDAKAEDFDLDAIAREAFTFDPAIQAFTQTADENEFWEIVADNPKTAGHTIEFDWTALKAQPSDWTDEHGVEHIQDWSRPETVAWVTLTVDGEEVDSMMATFANADEVENPEVWEAAENQLLARNGLNREGAEDSPRELLPLTAELNADGTLRYFTLSGGSMILTKPVDNALTIDDAEDFFDEATAIAAEVFGLPLVNAGLGDEYNEANRIAAWQVYCN